jgi:hypothetical protein
MLTGRSNHRGTSADRATVSKLVSSLGLLVLGLAALAVAGPTLTRLIAALVQLVRYFTRQ